jgi:ferritin-like metal-binding protein YciE
MAKLESLRELYLDEIKDIYDAEHQILQALPKMEEKATAPELKDAFREHFSQTTNQVARLEQVFQLLGVEPERKTCKGMKGLLAEGEHFVKARGDDDTLDAALIAAAQRVEHYEMAAYGTLRTYALCLGHEPQAELLQTTLDEEKETDQNLSMIAESTVNDLAAMATTS